jgi:hypothetical protein
MLPEKNTFHLTWKKCRFFNPFSGCFEKFFENSLILYSLALIIQLRLCRMTAAFGA